MKGSNSKYKNNHSRYQGQQEYYQGGGQQSYDQGYQGYGRPYGSQQKNFQADYHPQTSAQYRTVTNEDQFYGGSNASQENHGKYKTYAKGYKYVKPQKPNSSGDDLYDYNGYQKGPSQYDGYPETHNQEHDYHQFHNQHESYGTNKQRSSGYGPGYSQYQPTHGVNQGHYYEEDYYNDYSEPAPKQLSSSNKYQKGFGRGGYPKHNSDRKNRPQQHSLNTTKSISSGSQEGKNSQGKKSSDQDYQDDYQFSTGSKQQQNTQPALTQGSNPRIRRHYVCYVCRHELKDFEKEFYPCNCKYQICYSCYYDQVENAGRKCPNCGKHYEVNRVEEYKQSKMIGTPDVPDFQQQTKFPPHACQKTIEPQIIHRYIPKVKTQESGEVKINECQKIHPEKEEHQINNKQNSQNQNQAQIINLEKVPKQEKETRQQTMILQGNVHPFAIDIPFQPKVIKTDEDIPFESYNLISPSYPLQQTVDEPFVCPLVKTVHQKYDLVSKNSHEEDIEQSLRHVNYPQFTGPEPEDSEYHVDQVSMRSAHTQNNNFSKQQGGLRRMNSQENILLSQPQFLNNMANSQSGYGNNQSMTNNKSSEIKDRIHQTIKGIKLSKIRIVQKSTVYVIGLSPALADESLIRRYEYFGQYGKILQIAVNKDNAFTSSLREDVGGESTSSTKSQISYAAYITYSTPQDASLAIMALDQYMFDNRLIRCSYGRTKYCKYFLKNSSCPNKDCPYKHSESKEQDILTPDDMQKKALFQYCMQLAIQMSKITEMNESQFKIFLKHKRDLRNQMQNSSKTVLPSIESIFDNKDVLKKINQFKTSLLSAKSKKNGENTELSKKQLQTVANKVTREIRQQNTGSDMLKKTGVGEPNKLKKTRSGSSCHKQHKQIIQKLIEPEKIKAGERQSLTPRRHSITRMFSQGNQEIKIQDIKNQVKQSQETSMNVPNFMEKQQTKALKEGFQNLQANANPDTQVNRKNRLVSIEEQDFGQNHITQHQKKSPSFGRNRWLGRDRRKSVSKSIQRGTSMQSFIDYTLKFLNDDMAIPSTKIEVENPLIEKSVEDDFAENQSQINRMIFKQQQIHNQDYQMDGRSSLYSAGGTGVGEINLKKINNIYTSPFFLINSEKNQIDKNESVKQIWQNFDKLDNVLNFSKNQTSEARFESQSYQDRHTFKQPSAVSQNETINQSPGYYGAIQSSLRAKQSQFPMYKQPMQQSSLTLNAKPFMKNKNQSNASLNMPQKAQNQMTNSKSNQNISSGGGNQNYFTNGSGQQCVYLPKKILNQTQQKPQPPQHQKSLRELNEKNLYLFDKQQDKLVDQHLNWNKIFLNNQDKGKNNNSATSGRNEGLINSQSVFCFPMGIQDDNKVRSKMKIETKDPADMFARSDQKERNSFGYSYHMQQPNFDLGSKRKSMMCIPHGRHESPRPYENQGNLTPSKKISSFNMQNATTQQSSEVKLNQVKINSSNRSSLINKQQSNNLSKPFTLVQERENNTISDRIQNADDFDRRSAGERFRNGTTAYQELQKINNLFSAGGLKRRNSCSNSQSNSRVRIEDQMIDTAAKHILSLRKHETSNNDGDMPASDNLFNPASESNHFFLPRKMSSHLVELELSGDEKPSEHSAGCKRF